MVLQIKGHLARSACNIKLQMPKCAAWNAVLNLTQLSVELRSINVSNVFACKVLVLQPHQVGRAASMPCHHYISWVIFRRFTSTNHRVNQDIIAFLHRVSNQPCGKVETHRSCNVRTYIIRAGQNLKCKETFMHDSVSFKLANYRILYWLHL